MDNAIAQIMEGGKKLVDLYLQSDRQGTAVTMLTGGYHLVFAKVWHDDEVNACVYDFKISSEPLLVFGPKVYDPHHPTMDADLWLPIVQGAQNQFAVALQLNDLIGTLGKGSRFRSHTDMPFAGEQK